MLLSDRLQRMGNLRQCHDFLSCRQIIALGRLLKFVCGFHGGLGIQRRWAFTLKIPASGCRDLQYRGTLNRMSSGTQSHDAICGFREAKMESLQGEGRNLPISINTIFLGCLKNGP